jgi:hypothetical protein
MRETRWGETSSLSLSLSLSLFLSTCKKAHTCKQANIHDSACMHVCIYSHTEEQLGLGTLEMAERWDTYAGNDGAQRHEARKPTVMCSVFISYAHVHGLTYEKIVCDIVCDRVR